MVEFDPITGLPMELSAWDNIAKENQKIKIKIIKKKFGKQYTVVEGLNASEINIKDIKNRNLPFLLLPKNFHRYKISLIIYFKLLLFIYIKS